MNCKPTQRKNFLFHYGETMNPMLSTIAHSSSHQEHPEWSRLKYQTLEKRCPGPCQEHRVEARFECTLEWVFTRGALQTIH